MPSKNKSLFTSESVTEGHPDKIADQISDAILDAFIANDVKLGIAELTVYAFSTENWRRPVDEPTEEDLAVL